MNKSKRILDICESFTNINESLYTTEVFGSADESKLKVGDVVKDKYTPKFKLLEKLNTDGLVIWKVEVLESGTYNTYPNGKMTKTVFHDGDIRYTSPAGLMDSVGKSSYEILRDNKRYSD